MSPSLITTSSVEKLSSSLSSFLMTPSLTVNQGK